MPQEIRDALDWIFQQPLRQIPVLLKILQVVRRQQRGIPRDLGLLPREVQPWLEWDLAEQTVRRFMAMLWRAGLLERIGGEGARRGYRVAA